MSKAFIVRYIDDTTPRSDGKDGKPTNMTVGKLYHVRCTEHSSGVEKYIVRNDTNKVGKYLVSRFEEVGFKQALLDIDAKINGSLNYDKMFMVGEDGFICLDYGTQNLEQEAAYFRKVADQLNLLADYLGGISTHEN